MIGCPNKNLSEWKELEAEYGESYAMMAYLRNASEIPTIDQAYALLNANLESTRMGDTISDPYMKTNLREVSGTENTSTSNISELNKERKISPTDDLVMDMLDNFNDYFPDLRYLSDQQRLAMATNVANGRLTIKCGL